MSHNSIIYNDLGNSEFSVWANLHPELDPGKWAGLCRAIGKLSNGEFSAILALLQCHTSLKNALKRHITGHFRSFLKSILIPLLCLLLKLYVYKGISPHPDYNYFNSEDVGLFLRYI